MLNNYFFLKTKKTDDFFKAEHNDKYLSSLFDFFRSGFFITCVKRELLNPLSRGITGNRIFVKIEGENAIIGPLFVDDPDEFAIIIDRTKLLNLINKWEEVIKLKPDEILFKRISSCIKIEPIFYEPKCKL